MPTWTFPACSPKMVNFKMGTWLINHVINHWTQSDTMVFFMWILQIMEVIRPERVVLKPMVAWGSPMLSKTPLEENKLRLKWLKGWNVWVCPELRGSNHLCQFQAIRRPSNGTHFWNADDLMFRAGLGVPRLFHRDFRSFNRVNSSGSPAVFEDLQPTSFSFSESGLLGGSPYRHE